MDRMRVLRVTSAAMALLLVAGCATSGFVSSTQSAVDGKTRFALVRWPGQSSNVDDAILNALFTGLSSHDYVASRPDQADLLVSYRILSVNVPSDGRFSNGWDGMRVYTAAEVEKYYFPANIYIFRTDSALTPGGRPIKVLLLSVWDAKNNKILWRGWQTFAPRYGLNPARARSMIDHILARMPFGSHAT